MLNYSITLKMLERATYLIVNFDGNSKKNEVENEMKKVVKEGDDILTRSNEDETTISCKVDLQELSIGEIGITMIDIEYILKEDLK